MAAHTNSRSSKASRTTRSRPVSAVGNQCGASFLRPASCLRGAVGTSPTIPTSLSLQQEARNRRVQAAKSPVQQLIQKKPRLRQRLQARLRAVRRRQALLRLRPQRQTNKNRIELYRGVFDLVVAFFFAGAFCAFFLDVLLLDFVLAALAEADLALLDNRCWSLITVS